MPSEASIYSNVGANVTPLLNPLDVQAKKIAIQNSLAAGTLQNLSIQQQQQQMADERATRNALLAYYNPSTPVAATPAPANSAPAAPAPGGSGLPFDATTGMNPDPTGGAMTPPAAAPAAPAPVVPPAPPVPTMADLIRRGVPPANASGLIQQFQKIDETSSTIQKNRADALKAQKEANDLVSQQASDMANALVNTATPGQPINQDLLDWHLQHFASLGPQEAAQAQSVGAQLSRLSPDDQVAFLKTLTGTPKTLEANAAVTTANEKLQTSNREAANQARSQNIAALAAAPNGAAYGAVWSKLPPELRADPSIPNPAQWTPQTPAALQNVGMTPEQEATAAETKTRDAATATNERTARNQEQQNINLRAKLYNQQYGDPLQGATQAELQTAQMRAAGKLPLPSPRMKGYDREVALAAASDPTGTFSQYAGTRFDTIKNFTEKHDADSLNSLTTALGHLDLATDHSAALGLSPTQSWNITGAQHVYRQDLINLSGEVTKLIKNGAMTEGEGAQQIANLSSPFQSVRDKSINELKDLMGSKVEGIAQKYKNGTGFALPATMFDTPTQQRIKKWGLASNFDFSGRDPFAAAAPGAAPAPSASPAPGAPVPAPGAAPGKPAKSLDDIFGGGN